MARRVHVVALAFTALALLAGALGEPEGCPDEPVVAAKVDAGADVEVVEAVPTTPVRLGLAARQHGARRALDAVRMLMVACVVAVSVRCALPRNR